VSDVNNKMILTPDMKTFSASKLRNRIFTAFTFMNLFVLGLIAVMFFLMIRSKMRRDIRERLRDVVSLAALQVDAGAHITLTNPEDEGNEQYLIFRGNLQEIRDAATDIRFVYTMRKSLNGKIMFVVDAETDPEDIAHLGDIYDNPGPVLSEEFATLSRPVVEDDFYMDKWGTWLTGYAPFYTDDGKRAGVIGIDIAASRVLELERQFFCVALILFIACIPFLFLAAWLFSSRITAIVIRMQENLLESEERMRGILQHSPSVIFLKDTEGRYLLINRRFEEIFHISSEKIQGKTDYDIFPGDMADAFRESDQSVIARGEAMMIDEIAPHEDGRHFYLTLKYPLRDREGEIVAVCGIATDHTECKQAGEAIILHERYLTGLKDAAEVLLKLADAVPLQDFLNKMGPASNASRIYVFMNHRGPDGDLLMSQKAEWCSEYISPEIDNPKLQNLSYNELSPRWRDTLSRGEIINSRVADLPDEERLILEPQGVQAVLIIPIMVDNEFVGFVGFDNCVSSREWGEVGQNFLCAAANDLAQAIRRERVEAERKLLMAAIDQAGEVIVITDVDGTIQYVNPAFELITGYTHDEAVGLNPRELKSGEHDDAFYREMWDTLNRGETWGGQFINKKKDGTLYTEEATISPVRDASGKTLNYVAVKRDISDRRKAEEELRHLRNYLSNIINSMPSVLVGVDFDGNITQWNAEAERSTGISPVEAAGKPLAQVFPRLALRMDKVREAMQNRQVLSELKHAHTEGGETRYEDIAIYPLIVNGVEGAVIRVDDVTERVCMEEMMVQSEKMMSVGGLAAGMAHEINNPLAGMIQTAEVLSIRLEKDLPANLLAAGDAGTTMDSIRAFMDSRNVPIMLERIRESGSRAAQIVLNMLSFSRKSDSFFSARNLAELLDQSVDLAGSDYDLKKKYDFRRILIVREYEDNLPLVPCESGRILQVLLNILRNGAEAMHGVMEKDGVMAKGGVMEKYEGGRMKDEIKKPRFILRLTHEPESGMVRIEIEDNGPGMDESTRKRIFEPFFTTKPTDQGTGLGLSVSYFIITENHGGKMAVESTPGSASKFIIHLPIERRML
jgi:PAS domain S-box-containing protein